MSNVVAFKPRSRPPEPAIPPLAGIDLRSHLEDAAQTALDAAEKIMAALDHIEGDGSAIPVATANSNQIETAVDDGFRYHPTAGEGFRYRNTRGCAHAREEEPPRTVVAAPEPEPEAPIGALEEAAEPEPAPEPIHLPWRGAGNVVSAAGCAVLSLVGMRA